LQCLLPAVEPWTFTARWGCKRDAAGVVEVDVGRSTDEVKTSLPSQIAVASPATSVAKRAELYGRVMNYGWLLTA